MVECDYVVVPQGLCCLRVLPDGTRIKKTKIRGQLSMGMICSERELGLSDEHQGIIVLPKGSKVGKRYIDQVEVQDHILEIDNKSINHRPDLWGHLGFARELAAIYDRPLKDPIQAVDYPNEGTRLPVTIADKESQQYIAKGISDHFPDHGILAEEDEEDEQRDDSPAPDFLWVVDPLDGTKNFLSGLPIYACSVGVMYQGAPIAGAVFVPWPGEKSSGVVLHARKGGGACVDGEPTSVFLSDEPKGNSLVTLPGFLGAAYRFQKAMRGKVGEVRVTGSIAYELALVARGVTQYSVTTAPHLWDVAAGVMLVLEAGGLVMRGQRRRGLRGLFMTTRWEPIEALVPSWQSGVTTMKELRRWSAPLALGSPGVVRYVTANLRSRPLLRHRIRLAVRRRKSEG